MTKKKVTDRSEWRTEKRILLKDSAAKFEVSELKLAREHANQKGSYLGRAINEDGEFVGWYVPA